MTHNILTWKIVIANEEDDYFFWQSYLYFKKLISEGMSVIDGMFLSDEKDPEFAAVSFCENDQEIKYRLIYFTTSDMSEAKKIIWNFSEDFQFSPDAEKPGYKINSTFSPVL